MEISFNSFNGFKKWEDIFHLIHLINKGKNMNSFSDSSRFKKTINYFRFQSSNSSNKDSKYKFPNKGQVSEAVGFTILVIAVTFALIIYKLFIASGSVESLNIVSERHEIERLRSGINALFLMTEEKSGQSILNLIGMAAGLRNDVINLGPVIGKINVSEELEWRMDALFEKDHWHLYVPFPESLASIQIIIVADTSGSLCDDLVNMKKNLPSIIEDLVSAGRDVQATLYLLGGTNCRDPFIVRRCPDYELEEIDCSKFPETKNFQCKSIDRLGKFCKRTGQTEEDWGNGIACAARWGPVVKGEEEPGWNPGAARIGIVLSDELPGGSECCHAGCVDQERSLQNGIDSAIENEVIVFSLMADPCSCVTPPGSGYPQCPCFQSSLLKTYFNEIANKTGGQMFSLSEASQVSDVIKNIIVSINVTEKDRIDIGTSVPFGIRVRAYDALVPIARTGEYTKAYIYQWSY